jgi:uncharacterized protein YndB with AHSA1/START domain
MSTQTLSFKQLVETSPENAYRAFTNATDLRRWLCNVATVVPRPGGRLYMWWNSGYYTSGEFKIAESGEKAAFSWFGKGDPGASEVQVTFNAQNGGTLVTVDHSGLGFGEEWSETISEIEKGWKSALENLASVVATGEDIRFVSRPMLGIIVDEFNDQIAKKMGLPITEGIRLGSTVEGMGAKAAGLQQNDVLVSMGGRPTVDFETLDQILNAHRVGDTIEVVFYREAEKQSLMMTLSGRPIPEIPPTAQGLADAVAVLYKDIETMLDEFLTGVSEAEASFKPSPSEWSIKGNLAHFIHGERFNLQYFSELVSGYQRFADDYGGNIDVEIEATIASYPTLQDLVQEYKTIMDETLYFLAHLPEEFVANKGAYWQLAYGLLQDPYHINIHLGQMQAALEAARNQ